jgi:hypothetical protein
LGVFSENLDSARLSRPKPYWPGSENVRGIDMSAGDIPGWINTVIGLIGLYFLFRTYRKDFGAQQPAAMEPSAMPREVWLTPRRQFALWLILVVLAWGAAAITFYTVPRLTAHANRTVLLENITYFVDESVAQPFILLQADSAVDAALFHLWLQRYDHYGLGDTSGDKVDLGQNVQIKKGNKFVFQISAGLARKDNVFQPIWGLTSVASNFAPIVEGPNRANHFCFGRPRT